ncbi:hypothetical protein HWV62_8321 [Athelia sp. TMB]|nr:hypothetical protein HWV62_8321 [Athelia sp. TMB]
MRLMRQSKSNAEGVLLKRLEEFADAKRNLLCQLEELEVQIKATQRELNALHNLHAPTSSFPDEVLAMVFEAGINLITGSTRHFGPLVSHVTRRWRTVALATPRLWSTIRWAQPFTANEIDRVATFLSRSRASPVEIYHPPYDFPPRDVPPEFLQLTRDHISHCAHISIWGVHHDYLSTVLESLVCHPAPMLKSIDLGLNEESEPIPSLNTHPHLFRAPLLTIAHLSSIQASDLIFCLPECKHLTSLRLSNLYLDDTEERDCASFRNALMAMPSLYYLDLQLATSVESFDLRAVFLHTIKFLRVQAVHQRALEGFINSIYAKSLTSLYLRRESFGETRLAGEENWASHFPTLHHLIITNSTRGPPNIGIIARRLPGIKHLTYQVYPWSKTSHVGHLLDAISLAAGHNVDETDTPASRPTNGRPLIPWPELNTIAVPAINENNALQMHEKILNLQAAGYHIRKLKLPMRFFSRHMESTERLQSIVNLEEYSLEWPTLPYGRHPGKDW